MIVMAQAIMKIISKIRLTRMILMVQDTQIAGKKLCRIDQKMNINHSRGLSKTTFCFWIKRRVTIHFFVNGNYSTIKESSIQSFRELLFIYLFVFQSKKRPFSQKLFNGQLGFGCPYPVRGRGWYHNSYNTKFSSSFDELVCFYPSDCLVSVS